MVLQRIRVSFLDPDATDSDSGDDSSHVVPPPTRPATILSKICSTNTSSVSPPPQRTRGGKVARSAPSRRFRGVYERQPGRRFRGVYERQPGRWAADYRSHRPKVRRWIGTFPSEEEAKAAYDAFRAHLSRGASVEAAVTLARATATASVVLDDVSDPSEVGQADDALSTVSPCTSSLTSSPPPDADEHQMEGPFLAELVVHDGGIGLADLADLPLPSLDDQLDFGSGDWSMLNTIDRVQKRNS